MINPTIRTTQIPFARPYIDENDFPIRIPRKCAWWLSNCRTAAVDHQCDPTGRFHSRFSRWRAGH
jgi:hypothetical protein